MFANYEAKDGTFTSTKPGLWSEQQLQDVAGSNLNYDLAPGGDQLAIMPYVKTPDENVAIHLNLIEDFFDELQRRVPAGR